MFCRRYFHGREKEVTLMEKKNGFVAGRGKRIFAVLALLVMMFVSSAAVLKAEAAGQAAMYASIFDAKFYAQKYPDLAAVLGTDENALLAHFLTNGMVEGRQGCAEFNVQFYKAKYPDLQAAYGEQLPFYYMHYMSSGKLEGRQGNGTITNTTTVQPNTSAANPQPAVSADSSAVDQVIALCNQARAKEGLAPLTKSDQLCTASRARSNELVRVFSHDRPDGRSCFTIFNEYGISYGAAGENIAAGQRSAEEVTNAWLSSPGHRRNIMNPAYTKIGVGMVQQQGSAYGYYWTEMFTN